MQKAFQNVVTLEKRIQTSVFNFFNKDIGPSSPVSVAPPPTPVSSPPSPQQTPVALSPVDVSGFYTVTGPTQVTFYATTDAPIVPVSSGWSAAGITGLLGQIQVTGVSNVAGDAEYGAYKWSFTLQTDTDQNVQGTQQTIAAILYPPNQLQYTNNKRTQVPIYGYYTTFQNSTTFYFSAPPPVQTTAGWLITGLPTFRVPMQVTSYSQNLQGSTFVTLVPTDGSTPPNNSVPVYVNGVPSMIQEPLFTNTFVPGRFTNYVSLGLNIPDVHVQLNSNVHAGNSPELRDLNTAVEWQDPQPRTRLFPESRYIEEKNKGFSSGSVLSLQAIGPQEEYLWTDDFSKSQWNPEFKRYSNFVMYQKVYPFPPPNPSYQGQVVQIELRPTELGHLMSNMYLSVTLPGLPSGANYTPNVGRALLKQVDLLVNETIVETLYDDWYVIRDQMFLDADEQLGIQTALNPSTASPVAYLGTGGDSTVISGSNVIHTFLNNNTFTLNYGTSVNLTVVGGGGAGAVGTYTSNITSNIIGYVSNPTTFTVKLSNTVGAYVGANAYITVTNAPAFTTNVYVSAVTPTSVTCNTFGAFSSWSNIIPSTSNTLTFFNGNGGGGGGVFNQTVFLPPGTYSVVVGNGGTQTSSNGRTSSFGGYAATGGSGGAYGGASGTGFVSNVAFQYLSNISYPSGGGAGANAYATTGTGALAFTSPLTLGHGGAGASVQGAYYGGGGGGASNTAITGALATQGGIGGGGVGSVNVNGVVTQTISSIGTTNGFASPIGIAVDSGSNVYVADSGNNIVRKISPNGVTVTNIGTSTFNTPYGVAVDSLSNVYVSDTGNNAVKKVNSTTGVITTYTPPSFGFKNPTGVALDSSSNVFVVCPSQGNVFKINSTSLAVSNVTRPTGGWYGLSGVAVDAQGNVYVTQTTNVSVVNSTTNSISNIAQPSGGWSNVTAMYWKSGSLYVSDTYNSNVWSYGVVSQSYTLLAYYPSVLYPTGVAVDSSSNVYVANTGANQVVEITGGSITNFSILGSFSFNNPEAAVSDSYGNIYVAVTYENSIKKVLPNGTIITLALGNFNAPQDVAVDTFGRVYVADTNNNAIKRMNADGSNVASIGSGFVTPQGVAVDTQGNVYVSDTGNQQVKVIRVNGTIQTLAAPVGGWVAPSGLSVDSNGNVYVADAGSAQVYEILVGGSVVALATPLAGWKIPYSTSVDSQGNVYVADAGYTGIFKVTGATVTQILSGNFSSPFGVFVETNGNILVADTGHNVVKRINNGATSGGYGSGGGGGGAFGTTPGSGGSGSAILSYTSPQTLVPQSTITIPLEFFFCRRHSHNNKGRERLRKPYLPLCAMWNQRLYVRFTFHPNTWWCNAPLANNTDVYPVGTTLWPNLITEEILLENAEKLYYQNTPLKYIVNRVQKESSLSFNSSTTTLQLTANYPVQVLAWFFRNKNYEKASDGRYYASRYSYGYTTQYIQTGIQLQFPSGPSNFVDVIDNAKITLNNIDILSKFQGSLYYSFKQPMEHYLSIPSKNIYTYSFGLTPKEYNQGGYLNFSKLNSQTTYIQLNFNQSYTNQLISGYNLYLFYYGYSLLQFQGGFASLPFL